MANHLEEQPDRQATENISTQRTTRRAFMITGAGACAAAAVWALRRSSPSTVEAGGPATVTIMKFSDAGKPIGKVTVPRVVKTDAEWKKQLSPISFEVTRQAGTERAYTGNTWNLHDRGVYHCICCDNALFNADTKFESGTGWPSFWQPIAKENVVEIRDGSIGMDRTAISCRECDAHLGHVFDDGPQPTGLRYCMNSAAMRFVKLG